MRNSSLVGAFVYNLSMVDKIEIIKQWLGSGAINIFGIQFSGKDTLGVPLAEKLGAVFISSGDLVRAAMHNEKDDRIRQAAIDSQTGILTPTDEFRQLIVPHLKDERLAGKPLVLGSVGRCVQLRLDEFQEKTVPVIQKYQQLGLVIDIDATDTIEATFASAIDQLYLRATADINR